jgi:hypothetical protein
MAKALERFPVDASEITLINHQYLSHGSRCDPTMVWGVDVDAEAMYDLIAKRNRSGPTLTSAAHVLIGAVASTLAKYPELNCRIIRGRIYRFREINLRMICYNPRQRDVDILTIQRADQLSLDDIGRLLWESQLAIASGTHADARDKAWLNWGPAFTRRWGSRAFWWLDRTFRLPRLGSVDRHLDSSVVVNYLGFPGAPPLRMYKPSKFPDESSLLSVTLGRIEERPAVRDGSIVVRRMVPLFVRADHRVTDAYVLGRFVGSLQEALTNPASLGAKPHHEPSHQLAA